MSGQAPGSTSGVIRSRLPLGSPGPYSRLMMDDATEVARSILVVDDDIRIRNSLSGALSSDDITVSAVSSAEEALRVLAESRVHVVLTDLKMPGMNGIDLLRVVRERGCPSWRVVG